MLGVVFQQSFCGQAAEKQQSVESLQSYLDVMVRQMKEAHDTREEDLESRIRELKTTVKDLTQKLENVSSAYRYVQSCLQL